MASYTMQLREYIEQATQDIEDMSWKDRIEAGRPKLFDFSYPIFDTNYKAIFETHFIRNFYTREIGFETEGLFKFKLENWLSINMGYFNKMFESELLTFDPLINTKLNTKKDVTNDKTQNNTSEMDGTSSGTSHQANDGTATENDFGRNLDADMPESRLTITANNGVGLIEYATKIDESTQNNSKTSNSTSDGTSSDTTNVNTTANATVNETEDYIEDLVGKSGSQTYSKMVMEYRESFIRIEKKIFEEMQELFMLVY
jgi:hypothetical protein